MYSVSGKHNIQSLGNMLEKILRKIECFDHSRRRSNVFGVARFLFCL